MFRVVYSNTFFKSNDSCVTQVIMLLCLHLQGSISSAGGHFPQDAKSVHVIIRQMLRINATNKYFKFKFNHFLLNASDTNADLCIPDPNILVDSNILQSYKEFKKNLFYSNVLYAF